MNKHLPTRNLHIGFVSMRFNSTDGVSLESSKWCHVLTELGHSCFYFAGQCNRPLERSYIVPEAHFDHPEIREITRVAFSSRIRPPALTLRIREIACHLKEQLHRFIHQFDIHVLLVENALSIPMNIPLALALTELIAESGIPTIAHHHDLFWERKRYLVNCVWDYINMAYPPRLPSIVHVVINSSAANQLSHRRGIAAHIIPNVMDFDNPPPPADEYSASLRGDLGIADYEYFFLQPTRVVRRKGIEHAIEFVRRLGLPARLVISHASGDEGDEYAQHLFTYAELMNVRLVMADQIVSERRGTLPDGRKIYSLCDVYSRCDLVTYPSLLEGFGNAFLEAIYYKRPLLVNNYTIYSIDIKPKGFKAIEFDGFITEKTLRQAREVLDNPALAEEMTEHNYQLGKRYYSYRTLAHQLRSILHVLSGEEG
ncbi:MAG: glycosyltransferase family 4 protein [Anaerolineales bacterium]|nr:glycosyltransferase family 4 protein [Anaerolineales bacterium]MDW8447693.1 glycosyltransferase family 4 protein [Anaerolineales bacterium]